MSHMTFILSCYLVKIYISITLLFFFFNDTATTEIYTLSLHDALPISTGHHAGNPDDPGHRPVVGSRSSPGEEAGANPGAQEGRRQAVPLRHDARVPGPLRTELPAGPPGHLGVRSPGGGRGCGSLGGPG